MRLGYGVLTILCGAVPIGGMGMIVVLAVCCNPGMQQKMSDSGEE
jgi:hypothetical protein